MYQREPSIMCYIQFILQPGHGFHFSCCFEFLVFLPFFSVCLIFGDDADRSIWTYPCEGAYAFSRNIWLWTIWRMYRIPTAWHPKRLDSRRTRDISGCCLILHRLRMFRPNRRTAHDQRFRIGSFARHWPTALSVVHPRPSIFDSSPPWPPPRTHREPRANATWATLSFWSIWHNIRNEIDWSWP